MEEQSVLKSTFIPCVLFGGYSMAERVVAGFGEDLNDEKFPIVCVCAKPQISALPENLNKEIESSEVFAASKRIDVVISAVYNLSRNETSKLVKNERVFVNSRMVSSVSSLLNGGDVVSVRGFGRFVFVKEIKETKKGRLVLEIKKY